MTLSRPARGGWIEMRNMISGSAPTWSRPARGGWIEIIKDVNLICGIRVPSREGRVD